MERLRRSKNEQGGNHKIIISKIENMKKKQDTFLKGC